MSNAILQQSENMEVQVEWEGRTNSTQSQSLYYSRLEQSGINPAIW